MGGQGRGDAARGRRRHQPRRRRHAGRRPAPVREDQRARARGHVRRRGARPRVARRGARAARARGRRARAGLPRARARRRGAARARLRRAARARARGAAPARRARASASTTTTSSGGCRRTTRAVGGRGGWAAFYRARRLEPQLRRAVDEGLASSRLRRGFERLFAALADLVRPAPSRPRACTAICGAATCSATRRARRACAIRPSTAATARSISR